MTNQPEPQAGVAPDSTEEKKGWSRGKKILIAAGAAVGLLIVCCVGITLLPSSTPKETPTSALAIAASTEADTMEPTEAPTPTPAPTNTTAPTATTRPTATEIPGLIEPGTYLVGDDVDPGIYVGYTDTGSCYWQRLSGLGGSIDDIIANDNAVGRYYVEVNSTDKAFQTACPMLPLDQVRPYDGGDTLVSGMYLVGTDIQPGTYKGKVESGSCYWARLRGVGGTFRDIIANDNATGQFFVQVSPNDFALQISCEASLNSQ